MKKHRRIYFVCQIIFSQCWFQAKRYLLITDWKVVWIGKIRKTTLPEVRNKNPLIRKNYFFHLRRFSSGNVHKLSIMDWKIVMCPELYLSWQWPAFSAIVRYFLSCQIIQILLGKILFAVNKSLHRRFVLTAFSLMRPFIVVWFIYSSKSVCKTSRSPYIFFLKATRKNSFKIVWWNLSQIPFVWGLHAFVLVCSVLFNCK